MKNSVVAGDLCGGVYVVGALFSLSGVLHRERSTFLCWPGLPGRIGTRMSKTILDRGFGWLVGWWVNEDRRNHFSFLRCPGIQYCIQSRILLTVCEKLSSRSLSHVSLSLSLLLCLLPPSRCTRSCANPTPCAIRAGTSDFRAQSPVSTPGAENVAVEVERWSASRISDLALNVSGGLTSMMVTPTPGR